MQSAETDRRDWWCCENWISAIWCHFAMSIKHFFLFCLKVRPNSKKKEELISFRKQNFTPHTNTRNVICCIIVPVWLRTPCAHFCIWRQRQRTNNKQSKPIKNYYVTKENSKKLCGWWNKASSRVYAKNMHLSTSETTLKSIGEI